MEFFSTIALVSGMHIVLAMTPGPNTFAICCLASTGSRQAGLSAAAGVVAATGLWVGIALFGAGMAIVQDNLIFLILRYLTAAYLIWIGLRMLILPAAWRSVSGQGQPFCVGFLTGLTNPFAITFWLGAFLGVIPATAPSHVYAEIFCVIILQTMAWYFFLAILFSSAMRGQTFGAARSLRYVAALAMIVIGLNSLHVG